MKHSYENYIKRLIDRETLPVDEGQWSKMKDMLQREGLTVAEVEPSSSRRGVPGGSLITAAILLLTGLFLGFGIGSRQAANTGNTVANKTEFNTNPASTSLSDEETPTTVTTEPDVSFASTYSPSQPTLIFVPRTESVKKTTTNNVIKVESFENFGDVIAKSSNRSKSSKQILPTIKPQGESDSKSIASRKEIDDYNKELLNQMNNPSDILKFVAKEDLSPAINYGIKGGVFAGTGQGGYAGTFHLEGRVTEKVMFESDLGVINSLGSMGNIMPSISGKNSSATNDGLSVNTAQGVAESGLEAGSRIVRNENISYLFTVFNPSAGYKLNKRVTLKMGVDFQTNLSPNTEKTYIQIEDRYFRLSKYDFGLTPKVNVKIAPKLSGEFIYRNGLTANLLGSEYWNRNYFFAQLNYNLR